MALFNHLLTQICEGGAFDKEYLQHVEGFDAALQAAYADSADVTKLDRSLIERFCALWMRHEKVVTVFSRGVIRQ